MVAVCAHYILLQLHHFGKWHSNIDAIDSIAWIGIFGFTTTHASSSQTINTSVAFTDVVLSRFFVASHGWVTCRFIFHVTVTSENLKRLVYITFLHFIVLHRFNWKTSTVNSGCGLFYLHSSLYLFFKISIRYRIVTNDSRPIVRSAIQYKKWWSQPSRVRFFLTSKKKSISSSFEWIWTCSRVAYTQWRSSSFSRVVSI